MKVRSVMRWAVTCFAECLALALAALPLQAAPSQPGPQLKPGTIATSTIERREVVTWWPAQALVEAARQATLEAQVAGRISELRVDAGQTVRRGQVLARIEDREGGTAVGLREAHVQEADAALANATARYRRAQRIRAANADALSESALDEARTGYETARAAQRAAHAERELAVVIAPFDGVIARRDLSMGELAAPGKPLLALYDPGSLRLIADVPLDRLAEVQSQSRARVELVDSAQLIDAARIEFLPVADALTQTVRVRVYLTQRIPGLLPGSFARVYFATGAKPILSIAANAVLRRGEITAAYVVKADGSLALRQIRLGSTLGDARTEVLAGLAAGEIVVDRPVAVGIVQAGRAP